MGNKGKKELRRLMEHAKTDQNISDLILSELAGYRKTTIHRSYDKELLGRILELYASLVMRRHKEQIDQVAPRIDPHVHTNSGRGKGKHYHDAT